MIKYKIDKNIYSADAIEIAKSITNTGNKIKIEKEKNGNIIIIKTEDAMAFKKLMNEALNQQCRFDLIKKTKNIANIILTKSLISAIEVKEENT